MLQVLETMRGGSRSGPKTVLGFFNIVLAILTSGAVAATGILAGEKSLHYLIPYTLAAAFGFFVLLVAGIFLVMLRNPTVCAFFQAFSALDRACTR
jgi:hypothetical protein